MNLSLIQNASNSTMEERNHTEDLLVVTGWAALASFGLITNLLILLGITTNHKLRCSSSYWLIISLSICDTSMLLVSMGHLLPSTALHEKYVGVTDFANAFGIFIYDAFWYTGVLHLMIMAVNRYVNICRPKCYAKIFSRPKTLAVIIASYVVGILVAVPGLFECCYLVFNHEIYAAQYEPADTPYTYVDLTINASSIVIMILCYTSIVMRVRRSRIMLTQYKRLCREQSAQQSTRNMGKFSRLLRPTLTMTSRREVRLFFQFATVSSIFFLSFATWGWLPRLSGSKWVGLVVTSLFFLNNSTNPTVYLIFNATLRRQLHKLLCSFKLANQRRLAWVDLRNGATDKNVVLRNKAACVPTNNNTVETNSTSPFQNSQLKRCESGEDVQSESPCNFTAMTAFFNSAVLTTSVFVTTSAEENNVGGVQSLNAKLSDIAENPVNSSDCPDVYIVEDPSSEDPATKRNVDADDVDDDDDQLSVQL